jgi:hypothetical protein
VTAFMSTLRAVHGTASDPPCGEFGPARHGGQVIGRGGRQLPLAAFQLADVVGAVPGAPGQFLLGQAAAGR